MQWCAAGALAATCRSVPHAGPHPCSFPARPRLPLCRTALLTSVDPVPALSGWVATGGRLNVARALSVLLGTPEPSPPLPVQCERQGVAGAVGMKRAAVH